MNLGLNCQLHDCVYFLSVSRVRAFDYVCCFCCFGCWSSLHTYIWNFIRIILFLFVFMSLACSLAQSPLCSLTWSHWCADHVSRNLFLFFLVSFIIRYKILHYCILLCARVWQHSCSFFPSSSVEAKVGRFIIHWWWLKNWCDSHGDEHLIRMNSASTARPQKYAFIINDMKNARLLDEWMKKSIEAYARTHTRNR